MYKIILNSAYVTGKILCHLPAATPDEEVRGQAKEHARHHSLLHNGAQVHVDVRAWNEPLQDWSLDWSVVAHQGKCMYPNSTGIGWHYEDEVDPTLEPFECGKIYQVFGEPVSAIQVIALTHPPRKDSIKTWYNVRFIGPREDREMLWRYSADRIKATIGPNPVELTDCPGCEGCGQIVDAGPHDGCAEFVEPKSHKCPRCNGKGLLTPGQVSAWGRVPPT